MEIKPPRNPDDTRFRVLRLLKHAPDLTQREVAAQLGMSTSGLHYVLNALIDKGLVKIRNFAKSNRKFGYAYLLTPMGIAEKTRLTKGFVTRKLTERAALETEIREIVAEAYSAPGDAIDVKDFQLMKF